MNLQQWSDNCCRATLKPFAIDRTTHRSKRNRRICCIWLWLWWVETLSSSFLIQSNLDERTWKRYVVYRIRFRIRFYKYPRSKGRAETTRFFLSFSLFFVHGYIFIYVLTHVCAIVPRYDTRVHVVNFSVMRTNFFRNYNCCIYYYYEVAYCNVCGACRELFSIIV